MPTKTYDLDSFEDMQHARAHAGNKIRTKQIFVCVLCGAATNVVALHFHPHRSHMKALCPHNEAAWHKELVEELADIEYEYRQAIREGQAEARTRAAQHAFDDIAGEADPTLCGIAEGELHTKWKAVTNIRPNGWRRPKQKA